VIDNSTYLAKYEQLLIYKLGANSRRDVMVHSISYQKTYDMRVRLMVLNATFNNISVISWLSVLLVEVIGVPGEHNRLNACHRQILSHKVISSSPSNERDSNSQYL